MRVLKFGGACLASPERLRRVVAIAAGTPRPFVIVVSALAGVTDRLHAALAEGGDAAIARLAAELGTLHRALAPGADAELLACIERELEAIERDAAQAKVGAGAAPASARERFLAAGERLAAPLLAAILRHAGIDAEAFAAEHAGIRCDGRPGNAAVDLVATRREAQIRLAPALLRGAAPVVSGYYGVGPRGETATLGRSGSDYTATALGDALDAVRVELWKEVAGFLEADPRIVDEPRVIARLSYDEAAELAHCGARVLHPRALEPARERRIPIHVLGVDEPEAPGTCISGETASEDGALTALTARPHLAVLRVHGRNAAQQHRTLAAVAGELWERGIDIVSAASARTALVVLVDAADGEAALQAVRAMPADAVAGVEPVQPAGLVCAVGRGLDHAHGFFGRLVCAVVREGIAIGMVAAGASTAACHIGVPEADVAAATRALYREFFRPPETLGRLCVLDGRARRKRAGPG